MVKNFSSKYGKPDKTIFVMGDYHMKCKESYLLNKFDKISRTLKKDMEQQKIIM